MTCEHFWTVQMFSVHAVVLYVFLLQYCEYTPEKILINFVIYHAGKILSERQKRAADLKKRTDRASGMSESEIAELRHDIKVN